MDSGIVPPFFLLVLTGLVMAGFIWRVLGGAVSYFLGYACVAITSAVYTFAVELAHGFGNHGAGRGSIRLAEYMPALLPLVAWPVMAYFFRSYFNRHPVLLFLTGLLPFLGIGSWILIEG